MYIVRILIITLIAISGSFQAASLNNAMQDCAKIKRDLKRLACFDKLSGRADSFATETLSQPQQRAVNKPAAAAVVVDTPKTSESSFGLPVKSDSADIDVITSYIPGKFKGWRKGDEITLANGQVWKVNNNSNSLSHTATNPKIEIRRGVFDSYRIKVIGLNKSAQVKRIK